MTASVCPSIVPFGTGSQYPKTDNALRRIALSQQLVTLLWEQIARQKAKEHEFLFTTATGTPWDMNVYRQRKMKKLLSSLELPLRGFHALRHFNAALLDALCIPLLVRRERLGHAFTGSFTLDVYGGQPEWKGNVDAAQKLGASIDEAVQMAKDAAKAESFVSLTAISENGSQGQSL